jgi:hypothetical protein
MDAIVWIGEERELGWEGEMPSLPWRSYSTYLSKGQSVHSLGHCTVRKPRKRRVALFTRCYFTVHAAKTAAG